MARPISTSYSDTQRAEIIDHVLAELSAGIPISRTLGPEKEEWLCTERCFWNWYYQADANDENGLVQKVARARDCGIEAKMDQAMQVAETPMVGEIKIDKHINVGGAAVPVTEVRYEDMIAHRRLLVDTIIKQAQMLKPKTYGPKLDLTSGGEKVQLDETAIAARTAALLSKGLGRAGSD